MSAVVLNAQHNSGDEYSRKGFLTHTAVTFTSDSGTQGPSMMQLHHFPVPQSSAASSAFSGNLGRDTRWEMAQEIFVNRLDRVPVVYIHLSLTRTVLIWSHLGTAKRVQ